MTHFADHMLTTSFGHVELSPGRLGTPHSVGGYWLDKRPDGRSHLWVIAWYDSVARTVRYKSTRTSNLEDAKAIINRHAAERGSVMGPAPRRSSEMVYFVGGDTGAIKIGIARDPMLRLASLQAGSPITIGILALTSGGRAVEMAYHRQFAAHRLHGEWFDRHPEILAEIERLSPQPQAGGVL